MNDADKRLIDAWRKIATPTNWKTSRLDVARSELIDLLAAFDRALAGTPTFVETNVRWCVAHQVMQGRCSSLDGPYNGGPRCDLRPLGYLA